ncbi:hypothetical protein TNCV_1816881 [Trichonephila clavipes]|nr:hypothetical protein TNCV_1816881 [Trichonephila clavipes]
MDGGDPQQLYVPNCIEGVASDQGPRNSSRLGARFSHLSSSVALSTIQVRVRFVLVYPNFVGEHPGEDQCVASNLSSPSINLTRLTMQMDVEIASSLTPDSAGIYCE